MPQQQHLQAALRQARAEAQAAQQAKSEFLATISHEIRTPLQAIISITDLLTQSSLSEEQLSQVTTVQHAGETLLRMLGDIIDFSKVESGQLQLENSPFQLRELITDITQLFAPSAQKKHLHFNTFVDASLPLVLKGDAHRLRQVLSNLVANAIKFTSEGSILLRITASEASSCTEDQSTAYSWLKFEISDTGIGIKPAQQKKLFQPFSQANLSINQQFGGSGLGLSIAQRIIQQMSGSITVDSTPEQGSTFHFVLKLEKAAAQTPPLAPMTSRLAPAHDTHILLVDDDPINQQVSMTILEHLGYSADLATNGVEALELYQKRAYDLILMDTQMPVMDGCQATRHIRELESDHTVSVPIIAFTAQHSDAERQRCLNAGMNDFLSKPVHTYQLQHQLQRWTQSSTETLMPETTTATTPYDLINADCLAQLEKDLGHRKQKVLTMFLSILKDYPIKMRQAVKDEQRSELKLLAHTLKGSGRIVGALRVGAQCQQLEQACDQAPWTELQGQVHTLIRDIQKTAQALRSLMPHTESATD